MSELSLETGMPVLPENYFWHVKFETSPYFTVPSLYVQIRKRHRFGFWSLVVGDNVGLGYVDPRDAEAGRTSRSDREYDLVPLPVEYYPEQILKLAENVLALREEQFAEEEQYKEFWAAKKALSGNYPPKKLESQDD